MARNKNEISLDQILALSGGDPRKAVEISRKAENMGAKLATDINGFRYNPGPESLVTALESLNSYADLFGVKLAPAEKPAASDAPPAKAGKQK